MIDRGNGIVNDKDDDNDAAGGPRGGFTLPAAPIILNGTTKDTNTVILTVANETNATVVAAVTRPKSPVNATMPMPM